MNKKLVVVSIVLTLVSFRQVQGQVQGQKIMYGGYFSVEYIKGQTESLFPRGSMENLQAGFVAAGQLGQKFGFMLEARTRGVSTFELDQAWAGFVPSKAVSIRAGLFLVPFGAWNRASRPYETLLIRTPLNLEYLYPASWRDLGVFVEGEFGVLSYAAYMGNGLGEFDALGSGQQFRDNNTNKSKGGRLGLKVGDSARAGISYYTGKYDDQDLHDLVLEGADLSWVTGQWEVHGEYTKALIENPQPFENGKSEGFSIWMAMSFKSLQPVGSYQKVKVDDPYRGGGVHLDQSRWTAGLRYVLSSTLFIKIEYNWNLEKEPVLKNNQLQVQAALSF